MTYRMLNFGYYNMDCMVGMKEFSDKFFDLAIVDPPYGIGENGSKNHSRGKCAKANDYKAFAGLDIAPPMRIIFGNFSGFPRIKSYGVRTTS